MISTRGSRPKIASDRTTDPASLPSSVVIFMSILFALLRSRSFRRCGFRGGVVSQAELARLRRVLVQLLLHRVAQGDPATAMTRHRAVNQHEAAFDIDLGNLEVQGGDAGVAHLARHLLVLEGLARILTAAGRTDRTM